MEPTLRTSKNQVGGLKYRSSDRVAALTASGLPDFVQNQFDTASTDAHHRQLYRILQDGIRDGRLPAGAKLPPTRRLAQVLGIARNTVVHVYEQLTLEGYVTAGVGRGTHVAEFAAARQIPRDRRSASRASDLSSRGMRTITEARASPRQWGAFAPGVPEVRLFPAQIWNRLHGRIWRNASPEMLSYATGPGYLPLRVAIADYLVGTRGVNCSAEQIIVTNGTQQSLHLVSHLLADPGDRVWLEEPGYFGACSVFRAHGLETVPVDIDEEGLAPTIAQKRNPPRLIFVSPSHQYPVGALMTHGRRRQLLDYAGAHGVWVVEDDYDSEFRYGSRPLPALQGLDDDGRVIYLGTFSKTLFPALRLAYVVVPAELVQSFGRGLGELFREGETMQQAVLAQFLTEGHYATHVRRMRGVYHARHDVLIEAIRKEFGEMLPVIGGDAGLHLVLGLPSRVDDHKVAALALRSGISTRPLSLYYAKETTLRRGLLLGYGAVDEDHIAPQFARLAEVIRKQLSSGRT